MDAEKRSEEPSDAGGKDDAAGMHASGRRPLLRFGAAAGADMAMGVSEPVMSQTGGGESIAPTNQQADHINIHAHFVPGFYREALIDAGLSTPGGIRAMPEGEVESTFQVTDRLGVATAKQPISSPGFRFGDDAKARVHSRCVNRERRGLVGAYPGRFGLFASMPLPDVDRVITETSCASDVLHADGMVFETNQHGIYLGDPKLEPLYAELNSARQSLLFIQLRLRAAAATVRTAVSMGGLRH
jgi:hypothetical protein